MFSPYLLRFNRTEATHVGTDVETATEAQEAAEAAVVVMNVFFIAEILLCFGAGFEYSTALKRSLGAAKKLRGQPQTFLSAEYGILNKTTENSGLPKNHG